ncbi:hypothetical protein Tco_1209519, partial [Tanacetum coccineum]
MLITNNPMNTTIDKKPIASIDTVRDMTKPSPLAATKGRITYSLVIGLHKSPPGILILHNLEPEMCYDSEEEMSCPKEPGILKWVDIRGELDNLHLHHDFVMGFNLNLTPTFRNFKVHQVGSITLDEDSLEKLCAFDINNETFQFPMSAWRYGQSGWKENTGLH